MLVVVVGLSMKERLDRCFTFEIFGKFEKMLTMVELLINTPRLSKDKRSMGELTKRKVQYNNNNNNNTTTINQKESS